MWGNEAAVDLLAHQQPDCMQQTEIMYLRVIIICRYTLPDYHSEPTGLHFHVFHNNILVARMREVVSVLFLVNCSGICNSNL